MDLCPAADKGVVAVGFPLEAWGCLLAPPSDILQGSRQGMYRNNLLRVSTTTRDTWRARSHMCPYSGPWYTKPRKCSMQLSSVILRAEDPLRARVPLPSVQKDTGGYSPTASRWWRLTAGDHVLELVVFVGTGIIWLRVTVGDVPGLLLPRLLGLSESNLVSESGTTVARKPLCKGAGLPNGRHVPPTSPTLLKLSEKSPLLRSIRDS